MWFIYTMAALPSKNLENEELQLFGTSHLKILRHLKPRIFFHLDVFKLQGYCVFPRFKPIVIILTLLIVLLYILNFLQLVYTYRESVPFQKDLALSRKDVFIDGELEANEKKQTTLNFSVDCNSLKQKHTKQDDFVYVSVLTSKKSISGLGRAVFDTWGQEPDKIEFFIGNAPNDYCEFDRCKDMPIQRLESVRDDEYPPQQKAFTMLEYVCQNHIDNFKWFVRADDDSYFKFSNLRHLLRKFDENVPLVFGLPIPGYWYGLFYLQMYGRKYCDGSAVIYSRAALKGLCPHLRSCSEQCVTHHEDVEVGRCVMRHLGLQCAHSTGEMHMSELFYHTALRDRSAFSGDVSQLEYVKRAIHMHKVPQPDTMHNLHAFYIRSQKILEEKCTRQDTASKNGAVRFRAKRDENGS